VCIKSEFWKGVIKSGLGFPVMNKKIATKVFSLDEAKRCSGILSAEKRSCGRQVLSDSMLFPVWASDSKISSGIEVEATLPAITMHVLL